MDEPTLESHGVKQSSQPIGPMAVKVALLVALAGLVAGLYLWQASEIAMTGRRIEALRQRQQEAQRENTDLLEQIAVEGNIPRLQERAAQLGFSPAAQVDYIAVTAVPPDTLSALRVQWSGK
jgi:Tfp pilus assembly protein PilN